MKILSNSRFPQICQLYLSFGAVLYEIAFDTIHTVPPGAGINEMFEIPGERIGTTPMDDAPIPDGQHAIKITKAGYEPVVATDDSSLGEITPTDSAL